MGLKCNIFQKQVVTTGHHCWSAFKSSNHIYGIQPSIGWNKQDSYGIYGLLWQTTIQWIQSKILTIDIP